MFDNHLLDNHELHQFPRYFGITNPRIQPEGGDAPKRLCEMAKDLALIGIHHSVKGKGRLRYNANCDLNSYVIIDTDDISLANCHFGEQRELP